MNKVQVLSFSLAAVLAGPVYAQVCSGGNDGGMDATGNQCNTPNEVVASVTGSAIIPAAPITKIGSVRSSAPAARPAIRLSKAKPQINAIVITPATCTDNRFAIVCYESSQLPYANPVRGADSVNIPRAECC